MEESNVYQDDDDVVEELFLGSDRPRRTSAMLLAGDDRASRFKMPLDVSPTGVAGLRSTLTESSIGRPLRFGRGK